MSINYRAELVGVFGDPVEDNPTGVMEEAAFAACGLNYRYLTLKVTDRSGYSNEIYSCTAYERHESYHAA